MRVGKQKFKDLVIRRGRLYNNQKNFQKKFKAQDSNTKENVYYKNVSGRDLHNNNNKLERKC